MSSKSCKVSFNCSITMASSSIIHCGEISIINRLWSAANSWKKIRGGICHAIHRYAKANNKYIKEYDKNKIS